LWDGAFAGAVVILVAPSAVNPTAIRRVLFALCLVVVPCPYAIVEGGRVPVVWLCALTGLTLASALVDRGEITTYISGFLTLETIAGVIGAYLVARLATRAIVRLVRPERRTVVTLVVCAALGAIALAVPIFSSSAVRGGEPTGLVGIFGW